MEAGTGALDEAIVRFEDIPPHRTEVPKRKAIFADCLSGRKKAPYGVITRRELLHILNP